MPRVSATCASVRTNPSTNPNRLSGTPSGSVRCSQARRSAWVLALQASDHVTSTRQSMVYIATTFCSAANHRVHVSRAVRTSVAGAIFVRLQANPRVPLGQVGRLTPVVRDVQAFSETRLREAQLSLTKRHLLAALACWPVAASFASSAAVMQKVETRKYVSPSSATRSCCNVDVSGCFACGPLANGLRAIGQPVPKLSIMILPARRVWRNKTSRKNIDHVLQNRSVVCACLVASSLMLPSPQGAGFVPREL
jgi:hypothetical protein